MEAEAIQVGVVVVQKAKIRILIAGLRTAPPVAVVTLTINCPCAVIPASNRISSKTVIVCSVAIFLPIRGGL